MSFGWGGGDIICFSIHESHPGKQCKDGSDLMYCYTIDTLYYVV